MADPAQLGFFKRERANASGDAEEDREREEGDQVFCVEDAERLHDRKQDVSRELHGCEQARNKGSGALSMVPDDGHETHWRPPQIVRRCGRCGAPFMLIVMSFEKSALEREVPWLAGARSTCRPGGLGMAQLLHYISIDLPNRMAIVLILAPMRSPAPRIV